MLAATTRTAARTAKKRRNLGITLAATMAVAAARSNSGGNTTSVFSVFATGEAAANAFVCGFDCNFASREVLLI